MRINLLPKVQSFRYHFKEKDHKKNRSKRMMEQKRWVDNNRRTRKYHLLVILFIMIKSNSCNNNLFLKILCLGKSELVNKANNTKIKWSLLEVKGAAKLPSPARNYPMNKKIMLLPTNIF